MHREEAYEIIEQADEQTYYEVHGIIHVPFYSPFDLGSMSKEQVLEILDYDGNYVDGISRNQIAVVLQGNGHLFIRY